MIAARARARVKDFFVSDHLPLRLELQWIGPVFGIPVYGVHWEQDCHPLFETNAIDRALFVT